jgi:hypothetical protein
MLHGGSEKKISINNMIIWLMLVEMLQLLFIIDRRENYMLIIGYPQATMVMFAEVLHWHTLFKFLFNYKQGSSYKKIVQIFCLTIQNVV